MNYDVRMVLVQYVPGTGSTRGAAPVGKFLHVGIPSPRCTSGDIPILQAGQETGKYRNGLSIWILHDVLYFLTSCLESFSIFVFARHHLLGTTR